VGLQASLDCATVDCLHAVFYLRERGSQEAQQVTLGDDSV
jgi:hypothetical protein